MIFLLPPDPSCFCHDQMICLVHLLSDDAPSKPDLFPFRSIRDILLFMKALGLRQLLLSIMPPVHIVSVRTRMVLERYVTSELTTLANLRPSRQSRSVFVQIVIIHVGADLTADCLREHGRRVG